MKLFPSISSGAAAMAAGLMVFATFDSTAQTGRLEQFTKKAEAGPHATVVGATFFGGVGNEEFLAASGLEDGTIVAFGNAWGPDFPDSPQPIVLGKGEHQGTEFRTLRKGVPDRSNPDTTGMLVFYDDQLKSVKRVVRFDWGVASITAATVGPDGKGLFVGGSSGAAFGSAAPNARTADNVQPLVSQDESDGGGKKKKKGKKEDAAAETKGPSDAYLARLSPGGDTIEWAWVFPGTAAAPRNVWVTDDQTLYADMGPLGLVRVSPDGQAVEQVRTFNVTDGQTEEKARISSSTAEYLTVNPKTGEFFFGGDRNTHTGKEPWRQPFLYGFDKEGRKEFTLWEPNPKSLRDGTGGKRGGKVSDSAPRAMDIAANGDFIVGGWSDGGNTIFTLHPVTAETASPKSAFGLSGWGMKAANSLGHLMRIDPKTFAVAQYNLWVAYVPDRFEDKRAAGAPNFAQIDDLEVLSGGQVAFSGRAATLLVQTPNALYKYPNDGSKYAGSYVAAFSEDFTKLLFSSYLPGCEDPRVGKARNGDAIYVSRSSGQDPADSGSTPTPTVSAPQPKHGGNLDGHIVLLKMPTRVENPSN